MTNIVDRFIKYITINTESDPTSKSVPTTNRQLVFAKMLAQELEEIGLSDVSVDDNGYVMAVIPSNTDKHVPTVGFIAHMDTSPDFSGENVNPQIVKKYNGTDITLNKEKNIVLSPLQFPELSNYLGQDIITTDGNSLLGADDKAGVAAIVSAAEHLINNPDIKHGKVCIGFTPDEEVGRGADHFDVKKFGAEFAYTIDGGEIGELEYENFNAAYAEITFYGRSVHPGYAKDKMINSMNIASEFITLMPKNEVPERTEAYEGFYHLLSLNGSVEETKLQYIIRDFDIDNFTNRKNYIENLILKINQKYGSNTVSFEIKDQYYNMKEKIEPVKHIVDMAAEAMRELNIKPNIVPIRGGTDGSRLSFMGLPTPNIFTGGHNFHGKFEYLPIESLKKSSEVVLKIIELTSKINK